MSIPANKADNKTPAYDIRLKRTEKTQTDDTIKDGVLEYGEALYNKNDSTFGVGDGSSTVGNLKVAKLVKKNKADSMAFYTAQSNGMATLQRETATDSTKPETENIYPKTKFWNTIDEETGISNIELDFSATSGWEYFNKDTQTWVTLTRAPQTSEVPARKTIPVTGVTKNDKVCISLCLSVAQLQKIDDAKAAEKVFGTITGVDSYNGGIIVYCKKVRATSKCYLNVFGG